MNKLHKEVFTSSWFKGQTCFVFIFSNCFLNSWFKGIWSENKQNQQGNAKVSVIGNFGVSTGLHLDSTNAKIKRKETGERKDGAPFPSHALIFSRAFQSRVISTIYLRAWNRLACILMPRSDELRGSKWTVWHIPLYVISGGNVWKLFCLRIITSKDFPFLFW